MIAASGQNHALARDSWHSQTSTLPLVTAVQSNWTTLWHWVSVVLPSTGITKRGRNTGIREDRQVVRMKRISITAEPIVPSGQEGGSRLLSCYHGEQ